MKKQSFRRRLNDYRLQLKYGTRYTSARFAANYDRGKSFEDYQDNLIHELEKVTNLDGARIIDVGAGTGQLVRKLEGRFANYYGFDIAPAMVAYAMREFRPQIDEGSVHFAVAPAEAVPMKDGAVDATLFPWSMLSIVSPCWEGHWKRRVDEVIAEAMRVTQPGGCIFVIETASLLDELPSGDIWHPVRRAFLRYLESSHGFVARLFRNDWDFGNRRNLRFYGELLFDAATIRSVERQGTTVLRENAGIWWKKLYSEPGSTRQE